MKPLLYTHRLRIQLGGKCLCKALSLVVQPGECWGILGRNGVGKSTLLQVLAGLVPPASGTVFLQGRPLDDYSRPQIARRVGVLFQTQMDSFPSTVMETALSGRYPHMRRWRWESEADRLLVTRTLSAVGLGEMSDREVTTLSGGERQRLAIATLLVQQPRLALLDEPVNHLDIGHQIQLLDYLVACMRKNRSATMMVLHDVNLAARYCDHLLLLFPGGGTQQGTLLSCLDVERLTELYGYPMQAVETPRGMIYLPA